MSAFTVATTMDTNTKAGDEQVGFYSVLYGKGHARADIQSILEQLQPHMATKEYIANTFAPKPNEPVLPIVVEYATSQVSDKEPIQTEDTKEPSNKNINTQYFVPTQAKSPNTMFWCIYEAIHGHAEYLEQIRRSGNCEIDEHIRIVDTLKKSPKRLKETSAKLTIEKSQALFGSLLTSKFDKIEHLAAYSLYYNTNILVVFGKVVLIYSPTVDPDPNQQLIVLYAEPGMKCDIKYKRLDSDTTFHNIVASRITVYSMDITLKSIGNYKMPDLLEMAGILGISTDKKWKKDELYANIREQIAKHLLFTST